MPVNDQESALVAIECAMARKWSPGTVFLLCAIVEDLTTVAEGFSIEHQEILASEQRAHLAEMEDWLDRVKELFSQVFSNTESIVKCGSISQKICEIARNWRADYILIGGHSFGLASRLALRGIAAQVLALAPCTVEAVRLPSLREILIDSEDIDLERLRKLVSLSPRKILIASDLSLQATKAIDWVADQQWSKACQIQLITVFVSAKRGSGLSVHAKVHTYTEEKKFQKHLEQELRVQAGRILAKQPEARLGCYLVQAETVLDGIIDAATAWGADLVITGAQGVGRTEESKAGSNAVQMMEKLDCSMIAVRPSDSEGVHFTWFEDLQLPRGTST